VSLAWLMATALAQLVVVFLSGSAALLADTLHNFSDALTAVPLWIAFVLARRRPTKRFTYGYGRAEDIAGLLIVVMIGLSAVIAAWQAIERLSNAQVMTHLGWVAGAGLVGCLGNELVARYRIRVGRRIGSVALVADGYHARTDGVTSLAVTLGAFGVWLGLPLADPIIGLLIALAIAAVFFGAGRDVLRRIMDGVDPALVESIEAILNQETGTENGTVRARWLGHELTAEATVVTNPNLTLGQASDLSDHLAATVLNGVPELDSAIVHVKAKPAEVPNATA